MEILSLLQLLNHLLQLLNHLIGLIQTFLLKWNRKYDYEVTAYVIYSVPVKVRVTASSKAVAVKQAKRDLIRQIHRGQLPFPDRDDIKRLLPDSWIYDVEQKNDTN